MKKSGFPGCTCRIFSPESFHPNVIAIVLLLAMVFSVPGYAQTGARRLLGDAHSAAPQYVAARGAESVAAAMSGSAKPISIAAADVFGRGREDAVSGFVTSKGAAIVVQRANAVRGMQGSFTPFEATATVINVPVSPDFITVADVNQDGLRDIIFGARGESRLFVMTQGLKGSFAKPIAIPLPGGLSALSSGGLGYDMRPNFVMAGVGLQSGGALVVLRGSASGLAVLNQSVIPAAPISFASGNVDATPGKDLAMVAGGRVFVFHGNDLLNSRSARPEVVSASGTATQVAMGTFVPHRGARSQLAVLNSSGEVSVLSRGTLNFQPYTAQELRDRRRAMRTQGSKFRSEEPGLARNAAHDGNWIVVKTVSTAGGANATLVASRTSGFAGDDISVVSPEQSRMVTISHAQSKTASMPQAVISESVLPSAAGATVPMRLGSEGRAGLVMLSQSAMQPMLVLPPGTATITVDTFADTHDQTVGDGNCDDGTGKCSLRAAIEEANSRNLNDTIVLPDGTYTLTLGELDVTAGMTIKGQSGTAGNVIIDGNANGRVLNINPTLLSAFDTTISDLTITNGSTVGGPGIADGAGLAWEASGTGTLTLSNVIVTNNVSNDAGGGGLLLTNTPDGPGHATINDSNINSNLADDIGGGAFIGANTRAFFNNVIMDSGIADNSGGGGGVAQGGGYYFFGPSSASGLSEIHGGQITNCNSISDGGGLYTQVGLVMDAGPSPTLFVDLNSAGGNGAGIYQTTASATEVSSFANVSITRNAAGGVGSGIYENSTAGSVTMNFGRFTQNQSAGGSSGLAFFNATPGATIDVTRNWWACNTAPDVPPCSAINDSAAAVNFTPWLVLSHTGSPNPIQLGPAANVTLTADFLKDSNGGSISPASIPSMYGAPIVFSNAVNGTLSNMDDFIQSSGTATATLTVTSGPTASADADVDGLTVTATITVQTANLTITKSHTGNFQQGQTGAQYTLTVSNSAVAGTAPTLGTVTVSDTLPAGLTATGANGTGWVCTLGAPVTCTRSDVLAPGASYPAITLTVDVASNAASTVTNTATVTGGGDSTVKQGSDVTTVLPGADLTITKTHVGNFTQAQTGATYTVTVANAGGAPTIGTVTVVDSLPAGLVATGISGTGWTCTLATLTCTRTDVLAAAASYPAITVTVNVNGNAPATVINSATVSGGAEVNTANDTAADSTTVNQASDLIVTKSHVGNFSQGQTGATYSITVSNTGGGATTAAVTVADALPTGLTGTALSGTGWTCTLATLSCNRADALAAASSYPPITLTVNVAANAAPTVTNTVTVSGGGEVNTTNDTASDPTTVTQLADLTVTKTHTGNFFKGQTGATYTLTVKNVGTGTSSGTVTLTDTLPTDLTATAMSGTGWACTLGTLSCTRADALAGGSSYPAVTLTVNVSATAAASVTNSAAVSGGGDSNNANNAATDPTTITAAFNMTVGTPSVTVGAGQPASFLLTLTFPTGASGTVTFACTNVPTGSACMFNPSQVTMVSGGSSQVTLTIPTHVPFGTAMAANKRSGLLVLALLPAFGMVLLTGRRRKWLLILGLVLILAIVVFGFTGCGDTAPGTFTTPGTYDIGVTAITNTNQQASTTVHVTVVKN